jgi:hypothetical protein
MWPPRTRVVYGRKEAFTTSFLEFVVVHSCTRLYLVTLLTHNMFDRLHMPNKVDWIFTSDYERLANAGD